MIEKGYTERIPDDEFQDILPDDTRVEDLEV